MLLCMQMSPATMRRVAMVRKAASGTALRASTMLSTVNDIASRVADGIVRRLSHDRNYNQQYVLIATADPLFFAIEIGFASSWLCVALL